MLALRDYGSSDENSEPENESEHETSATEIKDKKESDIRSSDITIPLPPIGKCLTIALPFAAAPDVVPTVSNIICL